MVFHLAERVHVVPWFLGPSSFAAGADPIVIKTMGRWSSDCFRLYVRACFEQTLSWTRKAGSSVVNDVAGMTTVVAEVDAIFGEDDA